MSLDDETVSRCRTRVGTVVRRKYRLDELRGAGATAAVYAATHRNGSRVALKVLHPELARYDDVRGRFLREGYVANLVEHPGIVRVLDDDDDDEYGTVFLVMELLAGETLEARLQRHGGRLPMDEVLAWTDRVLDVLAAAHARGIVHRDVKPENLFVTTSGELKVLDFGIARLLDGTSATKTGAILGTPAFMPPEQASGQPKEVDPRSDLWSVGAMVFSLVTGRFVHEAKTAAHLMIYAATQQARPIEAVAPWIPKSVGSVVNKALAFEKARRWGTAGEMRAALKAAAGSAGIKGATLAATIDDDAPNVRR